MPGGYLYLYDTETILLLDNRQLIGHSVGLLEVGRFVSNKLSDPGHCQTNPGGGQPANPKGV